ncbi:hypothetical protein [Parasitella parasitica]|uniref:Sterol regulatory element-binding protein cleavage-activating protein n=1 Tax=Parasitella parasitica TaxID=35722 RepID=A0A0B7N1N1_9FUNG|nr:hypothetical protein [Parasitella parasitica]
MNMLPNPIQLVHTSDFHIYTETEHIILHGTVDESAGVMLRGSVVLNCHETTKVRSITLKFIGKAKVNWTEGLGSHQRHYKEEKTIIKHEWSFLPSNRKTYHLPEGHYKWDFELPLPGDLPESVEHDLGQVYYRLKAVVERPTFSMNYNDRKMLRVSRVLLPSSLELTQSLVISNVWTDKLSYDISVPSKVYSMGSLIPITFALVPIAPDLQVRSVSCVLKEYTTLAAEDHSKMEGKVIRHLRDENFASGPDPWTKTELLPVPDFTSHLVQTDSFCDLIKIKHKLKFTVSLTNADGHISELRAAIPVVIAEISPEEDENALPAYEDAWKSVPYDPQQVAALVARGDLPPSIAISVPNEAASGANTTLSSSDTDDEDHHSRPSTPIPSGSVAPADGGLTFAWQGIDLSRSSPHIQSVDAVTIQNNPSFVVKQIRISNIAESTISKELLTTSLSIYQALTVSNKLRDICATTRHRQCIVHSPLAIWDYNQHAIEKDLDVKSTLNRHLHDVSKLTGLSLHPYATMGQVLLDDKGNLASANSVILTFTLKNTTNTQTIWKELLKNLLQQCLETAYSSSLDVEPYSLQFKLKLMPADYSPLKLATAVLFIVGLFIAVRAQFSKSTSLRSTSGLGIATLFLAVACYTTTMGILHHFFRTTIHATPWLLQLLVCCTATLEHALYLTSAVVSIDKGVGIKERVGKGLQQVGIIMTTTLFGELVVLGTGCKLKAPSVKSFCAFTSLALIVAYTLNLTLFIAVLSIDIKRAELADLGNEPFEKPDIVGARSNPYFQSSDSGSSNSRSKTKRAFNAFFVSYRIFGIQIKLNETINGIQLCVVILLLNFLLPEPNPKQALLSSSQKQWNKISSQFWEALNPTYMNQELQVHAPQIIIVSPKDNYSFAVDKQQQQQQQRLVINQLQSYYNESFAALRQLMSQRSSQSSVFDSFHPYLLFAYSVNIPSIVLFFMLVCIIMWMTPLIRERFMLPFLRKAFVRIVTCILLLLSSVAHIQTEALIRKFESEYNEDGMHLGAISLQSRFNVLQNQTSIRNVAVKTLMGAHLADVRAIHARGNLIASIGQQDGEIVLWDTARGERVARLDTLKKAAEENRQSDTKNYTRHLAHARCIQIDQDQSYIAAGFEYGLICVWSADTAQLVHELNVSQNQLCGPAAVQDRVIRLLFIERDRKSSIEPHKYILSVHRNGKLREWNIQTGDMTRCIDSRHTREITRAQLIPNNQATDTNTFYIITASKDGAAKCWSRTAAQWTLVYTISCHSMVTSIAAEQLRNGMGVLVTGSNDGAVQVWNLDTGTAVCTLSQGGVIRNKLGSAASAEVGGPLLQFSTVARSTPSNDSSAPEDSSLLKSDHSDAVSQVVITRIGNPEFEDDVCPGCSTPVNSGFIVASCALDESVHVWRLDRTALSNKEPGCTRCANNYHLRRQQPPRNLTRTAFKPKQKRMQNSNSSRFNTSGEESDACQQHQEMALSSLFLGKLSQEGGRGLVFCDNMILAGCRRRQRRGYMVDGINEDGNNGDWEAWFTSLQYYEPPLIKQDSSMIPVITFDLEQQDANDDEKISRPQEQIWTAREQFLLKMLRIKKVRHTASKPNIVSRKNVKSKFALTAKRNLQFKDIDDDNDSVVTTENEDFNNQRQGDYDEAFEALPFATIRHIVPLEGGGLCCDYGNFIKVITFGNKEELHSST